MGKKCTITWYILHILLSLICKFAITRKNNAFVAKIVITRLTKSFMAMFAPAESLPSPATLDSSIPYYLFLYMMIIRLIVLQVSGSSKEALADIMEENKVCDVLTVSR